MRPFSQGVQAQSDFQGFCGGECSVRIGRRISSGQPQKGHKKSIWILDEVRVVQELGKSSSVSLK